MSFMTREQHNGNNVYYIVITSRCLAEDESNKFGACKTNMTLCVCVCVCV